MEVAQVLHGRSMFWGTVVLPRTFRTSPTRNMFEYIRPPFQRGSQFRRALPLHQTLLPKLHTFSLNLLAPYQIKVSQDNLSSRFRSPLKTCQSGRATISLLSTKLPLVSTMPSTRDNNNTLEASNGHGKKASKRHPEQSTTDTTHQTTASSRRKPNYSLDRYLGQTRDEGVWNGFHIGGGREGKL